MVWCDNCLLLFPLRHGAMALAAFMAIYSLAGSVFLFRYGNSLFYLDLSYYAYGAIGMAVMVVCVLQLIGNSTRSFMLCRLSMFLWAPVLVASAVRGGFMAFELGRNKEHFK
jgi:hypothetical protein